MKLVYLIAGLLLVGCSDAMSNKGTPTSGAALSAPQAGAVTVVAKLTNPTSSKYGIGVTYDAEAADTTRIKISFPDNSVTTVQEATRGGWVQFNGVYTGPATIQVKDLRNNAKPTPPPISSGNEWATIDCFNSCLVTAQSFYGNNVTLQLQTQQDLISVTMDKQVYQQFLKGPGRFEVYPSNGVYQATAYTGG